MSDATDMTDAIPAATLVVLRERASGPPDVLMVERAPAMAFAAGAMVFPGGRVDPGDRQLARTLGLRDIDDGAARIAAIRETIEEAGLPVGLTPLPGPDAVAALRTALHAGTPFAAALATAGVALDLTRLEPFARWRPSHRPTRLFDTRFFIARLPAAAPAPRVDGTENVRLCWATAQSVLDDAAAGRLSIIFPTQRNLERLARFDSYDAVAAHARATPVRVVTPWSEWRDGEEYLCIPDDLGYPITAQRMADMRRG